LVALALGQLLDDGLLLCVSLVLGVLGTVYAVALGHVTWLLMSETWHAVMG